MTVTGRVLVVVGMTVVGVSHRVSSRMAESGGIIAVPDDIQMLFRWTTDSDEASMAAVDAMTALTRSVTRSDRQTR
jgi:hypothetical protein